MPDNNTTIPSTDRGMNDRSLDINTSLAQTQSAFEQATQVHEMLPVVTPGLAKAQAPSGGRKRDEMYDAFKGLTDQVDNATARHPEDNSYISKVDLPKDYDRYPVYYQGLNNEDREGKRQGTLEKLGYGLARGLNSAGKVFADNTIGLVANTASWLSGGGFIDTDWNKMSKAWGDSVEKSTPLYITDAEKNKNWYDPTGWITGNHIAGLMENMGFVAGMAGSMYAFGGLGNAAEGISVGKTSLQLGEVETTLGARLSGNVAYKEGVANLAKINSVIGDVPEGSKWAAQITEEINGAKTAQDVVKVTKKWKDLAETYSTQAKLYGQGKNALITATANLGMASGMGYDANLNFTQKMYDEIRTKENREPSAEEKAKIKELAGTVGTVTTVLTTLASMVSFGGVFKGLLNKEGTEVALRESIDDIMIKGEKGQLSMKGTPHLGETVYEPYKFSPTATSKIGQFGQKAWDVTKRISGKAGTFIDPWAGAGMVEFSTISPTVENYYGKKYMTGEEDVAGAIGSTFKDMSIKDLLGTFVTGMLAPMPFEIAGKLRETKATKDNTSAAAKAFTDNYMGGYLHMLQGSISRGKVISRDIVEKERVGDKEGANNSRREQWESYLYPRIRHGQKWLVDQDIQGYREEVSTEEGIRRLQAKGEFPKGDNLLELKDNFLAHLDEMKKQADAAESYYKAITLEYGGYTDAAGKRIFNDEHVEKMMYLSGMTDYSSERIDKIAGELRTSDVLTSLYNGADKDLNKLILALSKPTIDPAVVRVKDIESSARSIADKLFKAIADKVKDNTLPIDKAKELRTKLANIIRFQADKSNYISEYKNIINNPEAHTDNIKEQLVPSSTSGTPQAAGETNVIKGPTIKLIHGNSVKDDKGKTVPSDIEVGKEYSAGMKMVPASYKGHIGSVGEFAQFTVVGEHYRKVEGQVYRAGQPDISPTPLLNPAGDPVMKGRHIDIQYKQGDSILQKAVKAEQFAQYKLVKVEDLDKNTNLSWYMRNYKKGVTFQFQHNNDLARKEGFIKYNPETKGLEFEYIGPDGKPLRRPIDAKDFKPTLDKDGNVLHEARIKSTGFSVQEILSKEEYEKMKKDQERNDPNGQKRAQALLTIVGDQWREADNKLREINENIAEHEEYLKLEKEYLDKWQESIKGEKTSSKKIQTVLGKIRVANEEYDKLQEHLESMYEQRDDLKGQLEYLQGTLRDIEDLGLGKEVMDKIQESQDSMKEMIGHNELATTALETAVGKLKDFISKLYSTIANKIKRFTREYINAPDNATRELRAIMVASKEAIEEQSYEQGGRREEDKALQMIDWFEKYPDYFKDREEIEGESSKVDLTEQEIKDLQDKIAEVQAETKNFRSQLKASEKLLSTLKEKWDAWMKEDEVNKLFKRASTSGNVANSIDSFQSRMNAGIQGSVEGTTQELQEQKHPEVTVFQTKPSVENYASTVVIHEDSAFPDSPLFTGYVGNENVYHTLTVDGEQIPWWKREASLFNKVSQGHQPEGTTGTVKAVPIHVGNQEASGYTGFLPDSYEYAGETIQNSDAKRGTLAVLYVYEDANDSNVYWTVDKEGNKLRKVDEVPTDETEKQEYYNNLTYGILRSGELEGITESAKGRDAGKKFNDVPSDPAEKARLQLIIDDFREGLMKRDNIWPVLDGNLSQGILKISKDQNGKTVIRNHSVADAGVITTEQLSIPGTLEVAVNPDAVSPKMGILSTGSRGFLGRTYINTATGSYMVNTRRIQPHEAPNLFKLIQKVAKGMYDAFNKAAGDTGKEKTALTTYTNSAEAKEIQQFLGDMLYYKAPAKGTSGERGMIYFGQHAEVNESGNQVLVRGLYIHGVDDKVNFYPIADLLTNEDARIRIEALIGGIEDGQPGLFHNVNNVTLKNPLEAWNHLTVNEDGTLSREKWSNYQHYLLSGERPDGTKRKTGIGGDIPVSTNAIKPQGIESPIVGRMFKVRHTDPAHEYKAPEKKAPEKAPVSAPPLPSLSGDVKEEPIKIQVAGKDKYVRIGGDPQELIMADVVKDGEVIPGSKVDVKVYRGADNKIVVEPIAINGERVPEDLIAIKATTNVWQDRLNANDKAPIAKQPTTSAVIKIDIAGELTDVKVQDAVQFFPTKDTVRDGETIKGVSVGVKVSRGVDGKIIVDPVSIDGESVPEDLAAIRATTNVWQSRLQDKDATAVTPTPVTSTPVSDIDAKKAEIEKRKQEELAIVPTNNNKDVSTFVSGFRNTFDKLMDKLNIDKSDKTSRAKINEVFRRYGYGTTDEIDENKANQLYKDYAKKIHPDKFQDENIKNIATEFISQLNEAKKEGNVTALNNIYRLFIEEKYNAELAALDKEEAGTTEEAKRGDIEKYKKLKVELTGQGKTFEIEVIGDKRPFLLTVDIGTGRFTLWGDKQPDGTYRTTQDLPSAEDVQKLVDKYIPKELSDALTKWSQERNSGSLETRLDRADVAEQEVLKLTKKPITTNSYVPPSAPFPDANLRTIQPGEVAVQDAAKKEQLGQFLKRALPQLTLQESDDIIRLAGRPEAWGMTKGNLITLYKSAPEVAGYHESFHPVIDLLATNREKKDMYNEFRNRKGGFYDLESSKMIRYKDATDFQINDQLSEEFGKFKVTGQLMDVAPMKKNFFQRLWNALKALFHTPTTIHDIFQAVEKGEFATRELREYKGTENLSAIRSLQEKGISMQTINTTVRGVVGMVGARLRTEPGIWQKLRKGEMTEDDLLNPIKEELIRTNWHDVVTNWEDFRKEIITVLHANGLKSTKGKLVKDGIKSSEDIKETRGEDANNKDYAVDKLMLDSKVNAAAEIRALYNFNIHAQFPQDRRHSKSNKPLQEYNPDMELPPAIRETNGMPKMVGDNKDWYLTMSALANTTGLENIKKKFRELAAQNPNLVRIYKAVFGEEGAQMTIDQIKLQNLFIKTFNKQNINDMMTVIEENGNVFGNNINKNAAARQKIGEFLSNIRGMYNPAKPSESIVAIDRYGNYTFKKGSEPKLSITTNAAQNERNALQFLKNIGFEFPESIFKRLKNQSDKEKVVGVASKIAGLLPKISTKGGVFTMESMDIQGPINELARLYVKAAGDDKSTNYSNINSESQSAYTDYNKIAEVAITINQVGHWDQLPDHYKTDPWCQESQLMSKGGLLFHEDGKKRDNMDIVPTITSGLKVGNRVVTNDRMNMGTRLVQGINMNAEGVFYNILNADAKTEWGLNIGNGKMYISPSTYRIKADRNKKVSKIFNGYLKAEIETIKDFDNRSQFSQLNKKVGDTVIGKQLRFFKDMLPEDMVKKIEDYANSDSPISTSQFVESLPGLQDAIEAHIEKLVKSQKEELIKEGVITNHESGMYNFYGLSSDHVDKELQLGKKQTEDGVTERLYSSENIDDIIRFRTLNYMIHNTELFKMVGGDPGIWTDIAKRFKLFQSVKEFTANGTNTGSLRGVQADHYNKVGEHQLLPGQAGYTDFSDTLYILTYADEKNMQSYNHEQLNKVAGSEEYSSMIINDGQSYLSPTAYRQQGIRNGTWDNIPGQEDAYQYDMAKFRQDADKRYKAGESKFEGFQYTDDAAGKSLRTADEKLVQKGDPDIYGSTYIKKPMAIGNYALTDRLTPYAIKTSSLGLTWGLVEGKMLEDKFLYMLKENIGHMGSISQLKIGGLVDPPSLYNKEGKFGLTEMDAKAHRMPISWSDWGIISETAGEHHEVSMVSQANKLITQTLFSNSTPVTFKGTPEDWSRLPENKKLENEQYRQYKEINSSLSALSKKGEEEIMHIAGLVQVAGGYKVEQLGNIVTYISGEVARREQAANIKDGLDVEYDENTETEKLLNPIESLPNFSQVKNIINSLIDKKITRRKVNGGQKIIVSVVGFENNEDGIRRDKDTGKLIADRLTFHELVENGKKVTRMQVFMPNFMKAKLEKNWAEKGITPPSKKALFKYLSSKEGNELLVGLGFRIPVEGLNFMSSFEIVPFREENIIKGIEGEMFMPSSYGDAIVVPAEMSTKDSSDFDVDKISTYLPNFYTDEKGLPRMFKFIDYDIAGDHDKELTAIWEQKKQLLPDNIEDADDLFEQVSEGVSGKTIRELSRMEKELAKKIKALDQSLEDFLKENRGKSPYDVNSKEAIENKLQMDMDGVLRHPDNFDQLVHVNSAEQMKKATKDIQKLKESQLPDDKKTQSRDKDDINYSEVLDPVYVSQQRQDMLDSKYRIGIGAQNNTGHSLAQSAKYPIVVRGTKLTEKDAELIPVGADGKLDWQIHLPHNDATKLWYDRNSNTWKDAVATLSGNKVNNQYIAELLAQYIDGAVDGPKDPWLMKVFPSQDALSTAVFLTRTGVPINDVVLLIHQPAVLKLIEERNKYQTRRNLDPNARVPRKEVVNNVRSLYPGNWMPVSGNLDRNIMKEQVALSGANKKVDNAFQQQVLTEYLKYEMYANHAFRTQIGTPYDLISSPDAATMYAQNRAYENSLQNNVISSPINIVEDSFLAARKKSLNEAVKMIGAVMESSSEAFIKQIEPIWKALTHPDVIMKNDDRIASMNKAIVKFVDFLSSRYHMPTGIPIADGIKQLMMSNAIPKLLKEAQLKHPDNKAIQALSVDIPIFSRDMKNVVMFKKPKGADADMLTQYFREFRDFGPEEKKLYDNLVILDRLQYGATDRLKAYGKFIPAEDAVIAPKAGMKMLNDIPSAVQTFIETNQFYKNGWNDEELVPSVKKFNRSKNIEGLKNRVVTLKKGSWGSTSAAVKIWEYINPDTGRKYTDREVEELALKGFKPKTVPELYRRIENSEGEPVIIKDAKGVEYYSYKQINALGDGPNLQEYYEDNRPSVRDMHFKIEEEDNNKVRSALEKDGWQMEEPVKKEVLDAMKSQQPVVPSQRITSSRVKPNEKGEYNIYAGTGENVTLSNMTNRPFTIGGSEYKSVEQYFQLQKYQIAGVIEPISEQYSAQVYKKIGEMADAIDKPNISGYEAKKLGGIRIPNSKFDEVFWDKEGKQAMKTAMKESFKQNPESLRDLLATGDAKLTHTQDKGKWGAEFPRLLTEVRDELRKTEKLLEPSNLKEQNKADEWKPKC